MRWIVKTNQGDEIRARFIVHSNGPLNRPKLPAIKGINLTRVILFIQVAGIMNTEGNSHGDLHNLKDKKVAIIGMEPAVQCSSPWRICRKLYVFQRTPFQSM